jgi:hypothetical protein
MSLDCPRCNGDNTAWERTRRESAGDALGEMGLLWLIPGVICVTQFLLAFYFGALDRRLGPLAFLLAVCCLAADALIAMIMFAWRFRIREYVLRRSVAPGTKHPSPITLAFAVPIISTFIVFIALIAQEMLTLVLNDQPTGLKEFRHVLYSYLISPTADAEMFMTYTLFTGIFFSATLFAIRRYADRLDLPQPIFTNIERMRLVAIEEYCGQAGAGIAPAAVVCRDFARTSKGGLSLTVSWMEGQTPKKSKLECDQWARILKAEELPPKPD